MHENDGRKTIVMVHTLKTNSEQTKKQMPINA